MLVIWVSLLDWRTKRDTSTRSGTNAGTSGEGVFRRGSAAGEGAMPASGAGANSKWRWGGPARGGDEMKKKAVEPAAGSANHGDGDPRCRHYTPRPLPPLREGYALVQGFFSNSWGCLLSSICWNWAPRSSS